MCFVIGWQYHIGIVRGERALEWPYHHLFVQGCLNVSLGGLARLYRCLGLRVNVVPRVAEHRRHRLGLGEDIVWGRSAIIWIARRT